MDNFTEKAFRDALEKENEKEFQAWEKFSDEQFMIAHMTVVSQIGVERMNDLCGAAIRAGQADTLAEYSHELMMMAFHIGYKARKEEEE